MEAKCINGFSYIIEDIDFKKTILPGEVYGIHFLYTRNVVSLYQYDEDGIIRLGVIPFETFMEAFEIIKEEN